MKDLNHNISKNDAQIYKNAHKIKKLDSDYKKNYISDLKQETQTMWNQWKKLNTHTLHELEEDPNCMRKSCCDHNGENSKRSSKKQQQIEEDFEAEEKRAAEGRRGGYL